MSLKSGVAAMALCLVAAAPATAQTTAPEAQGGMQDGHEGSLSSKLSKSGGVIAPKADIDPSMKVPAPAPHPNTTPVIPPSATGGNSAK